MDIVKPVMNSTLQEMHDCCNARRECSSFEFDTDDPCCIWAIAPFDWPLNTDCG